MDLNKLLIAGFLGLVNVTILIGAVRLIQYCVNRTLAEFDSTEHHDKHVNRYDYTKDVYHNREFARRVDSRLIAH